MIESDPVLIAYRQYEALRDGGADKEVIEQAWNQFIEECRRVMQEKECNTSK